MKKISIILLLAMFVNFSYSKNKIKINSNSNSIIINNASNELVSYLSKIYTNVTFSKTAVLEGDINLLNKEQLSRYGLNNISMPNHSEGYKSIIKNNKLYLIGTTDKGVQNGVYGLLEKLGYGFHISSTTTPKAKKFKGFTSEWELENEPVVNSRFLFNWHNFLSGCTGWNYDDWCSWIDCSRRMGYNSIMVHAYGNSPMFSYSYMGEEKRCGYINNSANGRDWGNQHFNDVRNLIGGELFNSAIYGAEPSFASENNKVKEATELMQNVFKYAKRKGSDVIFALDLDTWMSNPQNIMKKMPKEAMFKIDGYLTPNPEHPEGAKYFKHLLKTFTETYPEVDELTVWSRTPSVKVFKGLGTIWMAFKYENFPEKWQKEYKDILKENKALKDNLRSQGMFAFSKVVKVLKESAKVLNPNLTIGYGTWGIENIDVAHAFLPSGVPLRPLDFSIGFGTTKFNKLFSEVAPNRDIHPIVWANHDDYCYLGRPYTPFKNLTSLLKERDVKGLGIIHWTTHPLDIYFSSTSAQLWKQSSDIDLQSVVDKFVVDKFGVAELNLSRYYYQWITKGPMFGRETSDHMVDLGKLFWRSEFKSWKGLIPGCNERIAILESVPKKIRNNYWQYQRDTEDFYISFFENQSLFRRSYDLLAKNNVDSARVLIAQANPELTIAKYVKSLKNIQYTSGEEAIIISMNGRWLTDFINLKQRVGIEPIFVKYGHTSHDPLAQMGGRYTYNVDKKGVISIVKGQAELGKIKLEYKKGVYSAHGVNRIELPITTMHSNSLCKGVYSLSLDKKSAKGSTIAIYQDGKEIYKSSCDKNGSTHIVNYNGKGKLTFAIEAIGDINVYGITFKRSSNY